MNQDGSYLSEILLKKKYEVHGLVRKSSSFNTRRIDHIIEDEKYADSFFFHYGDLIDPSSLNRLLEKVKPQEIYNLGAQSHVKVSFQIPDYTAQVDAMGTLRLLDAIRETNIDTKFPIVPLGTSKASSFPMIFAAFCCRLFTVGSSEKTSSPNLVEAIA